MISLLIFFFPLYTCPTSIASSVKTYSIVILISIKLIQDETAVVVYVVCQEIDVIQQKLKTVRV